MNFMVLPPEVNSARIYAGAGPAPMLAAAVAWDGLAAELGMAAASFSLLISGLTAGPGSAWQGPAAAAMAAAAAPYLSWLNAATARAEGRLPGPRLRPQYMRPRGQRPHIQHWWRPIATSCCRWCSRICLGRICQRSQRPRRL